MWDGESRVRQSSPFNNREEGAVLIMVDIPNSSLFSICSGVVLRDEWILTVAHCLIDHDGEPFFDDPSDIDVESVFNEHEQAVAAIDSGSYNWTIADEDYDDDWALIKLDTGGFTTDLQDMDLWGGSDSTFQDIGSNVHLLGYPANILDSNDDCVDGDFDLFHMGDALTMATAGARVKFKADSGPQQSGAPYYFCPEGADDTCGSGELGEVVAIHAGYNTVENRQIGPKASSFDDTAIFIMDFF